MEFKAHITLVQSNTAAQKESNSQQAFKLMSQALTLLQTSSDSPMDEAEKFLKGVNA